MALIVQKYGGTSVGSSERIMNVAQRVAKWKRAGHDVVVVVSAMSGETNRLIELAQSIQSQPDPKELDVICSTGEQVTIGLLSMALINLGVPARSYTGGQIRLLTDNSYSKARILEIDKDRIQSDLQAGKVVVVAGFQGVDADNNITTLGRGGSDTSGVAIAAALSAQECQIYTDVDGVYTTDPRVVATARRLTTVTFEEMLEMASLGSKVLQIRAVEFAGKYKVRLRVLSSLTDPNISIEEESQSGTLITFEDDGTMEAALVSGIAFNRDEAKVTMLGVPDTPGIAFKILDPIANANIEVDVIVQNISTDGKTDFSFTVPKGDMDRTIELLKPVQEEMGARELVGDGKICKLGLVGVGMRSHGGVARKMFETLSNEGVNIQMISTSEIKITVVIDEKYMELAVRALHQSFNLEESN
ncbi:MAG: aspartate kinase [Betaproteobacteria bacterium]|jgi:aspartate kinase|nr:aspartate kinase [Betaproteobacteria bacterium]MBT7997204.1 aspartate kinase [Betaproteobacteria bacterium]